MAPRRCTVVNDRLWMMMMLWITLITIQTTITVATGTTKNSSNIFTSRSSSSLTTKNDDGMETKRSSLQNVQNNNNEIKMTSLYDKYFHKERDNILKILDIKTSPNRRQLRSSTNLNSITHRRRISSSSSNSSNSSYDNNMNYDHIKSCIESSMEQCPNQYKNGSFVSTENNKKNVTDDYVKLMDQVQSYMNVSFQQIVNKINTSINDENVDSMIDFINLLQHGITDYQDRIQQLLKQQQSNITNNKNISSSNSKNSSYQNNTENDKAVVATKSSNKNHVSSYDISDKKTKYEDTLTNNEALVIEMLNTLQNSIYSMLVDTQNFITIIQSSSLDDKSKQNQLVQMNQALILGIIGFVGIIILGVGTVVLGVVVVGLAIVIIFAIGIAILLAIGAAIIVPVPLIFLLIIGIISWLNRLQAKWENKHNNTTNTTSGSSMIDNNNDFSLISLLILIFPPYNIFDNDKKNNTDQYNDNNNTMISLQSMINSIESDVWLNEFINSKESSLISSQLQTQILEKQQQQQQTDLKLFDKSSSSSLCQLQRYLSCIMEE